MSFMTITAVLLRLAVSININGRWRTGRSCTIRWLSRPLSNIKVPTTHLGNFTPKPSTALDAILSRGSSRCRVFGGRAGHNTAATRRTLPQVMRKTIHLLQNDTLQVYHFAHVLYPFRVFSGSRHCPSLLTVYKNLNFIGFFHKIPFFANFL